MLGGSLGDTRSEFSLHTDMDGRGGQKMKLQNVYETKKGNGVARLLLVGGVGRFLFTFKARGPAFPNVLYSLGIG